MAQSTRHPRIRRLQQLIRSGKVNSCWTELQILAAYEVMQTYGPGMCRKRGVPADSLEDCVQEALLYMLASDKEFPDEKLDRNVYTLQALRFAMLKFARKERDLSRRRQRYAEREGHARVQVS